MRYAECTRDSGFWGLATSMEGGDAALYAPGFFRVEILVCLGKKLLDSFSIPAVYRNSDACGEPRDLLVLGHDCANAIGDALRFGTVGKPLPGVQVAIAEDGEILIGGPHVFKGYYRDPAATEEVLTADGWLRTGDLGALSPEGFLSITGRKKDLIITSSGKNIAPVNIESELRESRYVTEAVVYGDNRPYLVAMVTLDRDE